MGQSSYASGVVVSVKKPHEIHSDISANEDFIYCRILNIYVYKDFKIFQAARIKVVAFNEHLKAIEVANTDQHLWFCYDDLLSNSIMHLLFKNASTYIIDKQF